jgi:hypothetical protein
MGVNLQDIYQLSKRADEKIESGETKYQVESRK